jgi:hypothetical protein
MNKSFFILAISFFLLFEANAQRGNNSLKIHAAAELPVGDFGSAFKAGAGVHVTDYITINRKNGNNSDFLLITGFVNWKDKLEANIKAGLLLLRGGLRQFVASGLYFQGELGLAFFLHDWGRGSRFSYGVGTGYLINTKSGKGGIDISVKFNRMNYRSWVGLGLGYQFKL